MAKRIRVRGIARSEPDVRLYVMALLELVRQLDAEDIAVPENDGTVTRRGATAGPELSHE